MSDYKWTKVSATVRISAERAKRMEEERPGIIALLQREAAILGLVGAPPMDDQENDAGT